MHELQTFKMVYPIHYHNKRGRSHTEFPRRSGYLCRRRTRTAGL